MRVTTDRANPNYVPPEERVATFDQDGTLWVEHPIYSQLIYCLDRVPILVKAKPELANVEPFKTVMTGNLEAIAKLPMPDLEKLLAATLTGMSVDEFHEQVMAWIPNAKDKRWKRPYTDLTYLPMQEVLTYFRANGYKTYIVTGGGQDFVRVYSGEGLWHTGRAGGGQPRRDSYGYGKDGKPFLTKEPKLLLNDNNAGKPEGIHEMIGRRPYAAFGNSTGDQQMLEYTKAGDWRAAIDAGPARRRHSRIRVRSGAGASRNEGRHIPAVAVQRGEEGRLVRHQHEKRLEAHFRVRMN